MSALGLVLLMLSVCFGTERECDESSDLVERAVLHSWNALCDARGTPCGDDVVLSEREFGDTGRYLQVQSRGLVKRAIRLEFKFAPLLDASNVGAISVKLSLLSTAPARLGPTLTLYSDNGTSVTLTDALVAKLEPSTSWQIFRFELDDGRRNVEFLRCLDRLEISLSFGGSDWSLLLDSVFLRNEDEDCVRACSSCHRCQRELADNEFACTCARATTNASALAGPPKHCSVVAGTQFCAPAFLITGARSGTLALSTLLQQLKSSVRIDTEENGFWTRRPTPYTHSDLVTFVGLLGFNASKDEIAGGFRAPHFLTKTDPRGIEALLPHTKLVFLVRDPVERALSAFAHLNASMSTIDLLRWSLHNMRASRTCGHVLTMPMHELLACIERRPLGFLDEDEMDDSFHSVLAQGIYARILRRWAPFFGPQKMLLLDHEMLRLNPGGSLARVLSFLGVAEVLSWSQLSASRAVKAVLASARTTTQHDCSECRVLLDAFYAPYGDKFQDWLLANDLGWDLMHGGPNNLPWQSYSAYRAGVPRATPAPPSPFPLTAPVLIGPPPTQGHEAPPVFANPVVWIMKATTSTSTSTPSATTTTTAIATTTTTETTTTTTTTTTTKSPTTTTTTTPPTTRPVWADKPLYVD
jgi:hypothetical protein